MCWRYCFVSVDDGDNVDEEEAKGYLQRLYKICARYGKRKL